MPASLTGTGSAAARGRLRWPRELVVVTVVYQLYRTARIAVTGSLASAQAHAGQVVRFEKALGVSVERSVHRAMLRHPVALSVCDIYYGTIHFVVPVLALVVLFRRRPERYRRWRNVFGWMLAVALVAFATCPLVPPRLLPATFGFGNGPVPPPPPRGLLSWAADNPYAAMPSLHVGWATWCAVALFPVTASRRLRVALVAYPFVTLLVVVGTANHYLLDAVGGWLTLSAAWGLETVRARLWAVRPGRRRPGPTGDVPLHHARAGRGGGAPDDGACPRVSPRSGAGEASPRAPAGTFGTVDDEESPGESLLDRLRHTGVGVEDPNIVGDVGPTDIPPGRDPEGDGLFADPPDEAGGFEVIEPVDSIEPPDLLAEPEANLEG